MRRPARLRFLLRQWPRSSARPVRSPCAMPAPVRARQRPNGRRPFRHHVDIRIVRTTSRALAKTPFPRRSTRGRESRSGAESARSARRPPHAAMRSGDSSRTRPRRGCPRTDARPRAGSRPTRRARTADTRTHGDGRSATARPSRPRRRGARARAPSNRRQTRAACRDGCCAHSKIPKKWTINFPLFSYA